MLKLVLILLVPTAIFASNYGNHGRPQQSMSMDYNNDNRYSEIKPGSNMIFNFEQLRRDQPPQIEMRDESLGQYMHARPTTTTAPIVASRHQAVPENNDPFARFSNLPAPVHTENNRQSTPLYQQYNPNPSTPMPSPPTAPKWSDFAETFNKQAIPHYESQTSFELNPSRSEFNYFQQPQQQSSRAEQKLQEQRMPSAPELNHFQRPEPTAPVQRRNPVNQDFRRFSSTTPKYDAYDWKKEEHSRPHQSAGNRGSHKFGWDDLVTEPSWNRAPLQMSSTSAPVAQGKNPPPPLPTLTPWLDGFGK